MTSGVNGAGGNQVPQSSYEKELKKTQENLNDGVNIFYNAGQEEFSVFEINENSWVTQTQLNDILYKAGGADADELSKEYMELIFNTLDYNGDGHLDADELSQIAAKGGKTITDFSIWAKLSTKTAAVTDGVFSVSAESMAQDGMADAVKDVFGENSKEYKAAEKGEAIQNKRQSLSSNAVKEIARKIFESGKDFNKQLDNYRAILTEESANALSEQMTILQKEAEEAAAKTQEDDASGDVTLDEDLAAAINPLWSDAQSNKQYDDYNNFVIEYISNNTDVDAQKLCLNQAMNILGQVSNNDVSESAKNAVAALLTTIESLVNTNPKAKEFYETFLKFGNPSLVKELLFVEKDGKVEAKSSTLRDFEFSESFTQNDLMERIGYKIEEEETA